MLAGNFQNKIKKLNKQLVFIAVKDESKPIALYHITDNSIDHICGTDRNETPEFPIYDKKGHIIKSGWRRVLMILIGKKLISKNKAEQLFSAVLDGRKKAFTIEESAVDRALRQVGNDFKKKDDLMDIGSMIRKEKEYAC